MTTNPTIYVDHGDEGKGDELAGEPVAGEVDLSRFTFVDVDDEETIA